MGGWSAKHLSKAAKTAGLVIEIDLDGPDAIESGEQPPEADENYLPVEEIGEVQGLEEETEDVHNQLTDEDQSDQSDESEESDEKTAKLQAYQLGMQWAMKEAGVDTPIRREALLEVCRGVALGRVKTAEDLHQVVEPCIDRALQKLGADEDLLERELGDMPTGLRLALLAGGGAGLGALGGAATDSLRELVLGESQNPEAAKMARRRLMLLGALGGGGLGLYKHLQMEDEVPRQNPVDVFRTSVGGSP